MILELNELQLDYYNWRKDNLPFSGWLLSLNDKDFAQLHGTLTNDTINITDEEVNAQICYIWLYMYGTIELNPEVWHEDIWDDSVNKIHTALYLMGLVRKDLAYIEDRSLPEMEWKFKLTDKGRLIRDEMTVLLAGEVAK